MPKTYTPRSRPNKGANIRMGAASPVDHIDRPIGSGLLRKGSVDVCGAVAAKRGSFSSPAASARAATYGRDVVGLYNFETTTNKLLYSEQFNQATSWTTLNGASVTADNVSAPLPVSNSMADTINFPPLSWSAYIYQTFTASNGYGANVGDKLAFSCWAAGPSGSGVILTIGSAAGGIAESSTKSVQLNGVMQRFTVSLTVQNSGHFSMQVQVQKGVSGSAYVNLWGAQVESGTLTASHYVPTTTAPVSSTAPFGNPYSIFGV